MLMAIRPDLVRSPLPQRSAEEVARAAVPSTPYRLERSGHWASIGGHTDSPLEATPEGGQRLLSIVAAGGDLPGSCGCRCCSRSTRRRRRAAHSLWFVPPKPGHGALCHRTPLCQRNGGE